MARLTTCFGPHSGELRIYVGIFKVGTGQFSSFDDFHAAFAGSYKMLGKSGALSLEVKLTDQQPNSEAGTCELNLNNQADASAKYQFGDGKLTLTTKLNETPVEVYAAEGGTQFDGVSGHKLWIGP